MADNPDQSKTILVVDDSEDDILLLRRLLKLARLANPIAVAHGGEEALAHLKGEGEFADRARYPVPAVLILDLKMPRVDGFMVLQWIKQQPHLKQMLVIVLSAVNEIRLVNRAYELGAKTFLTKPCGAEDLSNLMNTYKGYWTLDDAKGNGPTTSSPS
jgi:CheY-like chemotaxis protein